MSFLDKLTDAAAAIGDKAGETIEVTKLKSKINGEKKAIEIDFAKIGKIYFEKMEKEGFELDEDAVPIAAEIQAHYEVIRQTERELDKYTVEKL